MTREDYANIINFEGEIFRTIKVDRKLNLKVGELYDNLGMIESWCNEYGTFYVEEDREYEYFFRVDNPVKGHEVDYEDEEEVEALGADGCENECEVLILPSKKFKIKSISDDDDYAEMGYYEVELEEVK